MQVKKITFEQADNYKGWHVTVEGEGQYTPHREEYLVPDAVGDETYEEIVNRGIKKDTD